MAMKDDAQMIILSAMVICLCLIGMMACVVSVDTYISSRQSVYLSQDTVDNIQWAQDSCAGACGNDQLHIWLAGKK